MPEPEETSLIDPMADGGETPPVAAPPAPAEEISAPGPASEGVSEEQEDAATEAVVEPAEELDYKALLEAEVEKRVKAETQYNEMRPEFDRRDSEVKRLAGINEQYALMMRYGDKADAITESALDKYAKLKNLPTEQVSELREILKAGVEDELKDKLAPMEQQLRQLGVRASLSDLGEKHADWRNRQEEMKQVLDAHPGLAGNASSALAAYAIARLQNAPAEEKAIVARVTKELTEKAAVAASQPGMPGEKSAAVRAKADADVVDEFVGLLTSTKSKPHNLADPML